MGGRGRTYLDRRADDVVRVRCVQRAELDVPDMTLRAVLDYRKIKTVETRAAEADANADTSLSVSVVHAPHAPPPVLNAQLYVHSYTMNYSVLLLTPTSASDVRQYSSPQPKISRPTRLQSAYQGRHAVGTNETRRTANALQSLRCAPELGVAVKPGPLPHTLDWSEWSSRRLAKGVDVGRTKKGWELASAGIRKPTGAGLMRRRSRGA